MSVTTGTLRPQLIQFAPGKETSNPRPIGKWIGLGNVNGDGSGGVASVIFGALAAVQRKYAWSVEEYVASLSIAAPAGRTGKVGFQVANRFGSGLLLERTLTLLSLGVAVGEEQLDAKENIYPAFGYVTLPDTDLDWSLTFTIGNPGVGTTFVAGAWGYVWQSSVFQQAGGPLRP